MEKLIQLQGIDTKLRDLNDLLGDLPSKVELLNQQEETKNNFVFPTGDILAQVLNQSKPNKN